MKLLASISVCLLVVGCVSTDVQRLDQVVRPTRSPDSVTVYLERPQQPYTVIATIKGKGDSAFDSFDDIRRRMIADAAQLGGDALILGQESTKSTFLILSPALIKSDRKEILAQVIVFDRTPRQGA